MSQDNVEAVRSAYEAIPKPDYTPDLYAPDFELDQSELGPDVEGIAVGIDAADAALREYWETFEDFRVELEEVVHADDKHVVTRVRDGGRMKGSDAEVWSIFFHVWTFAEGKATRLSLHNERGRALKAAGMTD
ncbi:MAG: nuclear transport factor 2 family protein [Actinomycetota bacterium]